MTIDTEPMFVDAVLDPVTGWSMSRPGCWVHTGDDGLVFLSESKEQTALRHGARTAQDPIQVPSRHLTGVAGAHTAYGRDLIQSATA